MELGLNRTAAIVGGASSGMGLAISRALAAEGVAVTMLARDPERLAAAAMTVPGALAIACDVRDRDALLDAVNRTVSARGRLDIVINNAGGPPPGTFETTPDDAWLEAFELSLHATIRLTKIALPHLRASGRGRVVNITSWSVREPIPNLILSNAIRPGVIGWAKTIAHELGPDGITVNTVAPGKIDTPRTQQLGSDDDGYDSIPARRAGSADEVAAAVVFLCSVPAAYISGVVLPVDGGALRGVW
jgi:3-oxoacyl-[acyl-carrier protein] reductase